MQVKHSTNSLLKGLIYSCGLTQYDLAERINRSDAYISEIVCGHRLPYPDEAAIIASSLGVHQNYLFPQVKKVKK